MFRNSKPQAHTIVYLSCPLHTIVTCPSQFHQAIVSQVQRYHTVVTNRAIEWRKRKEVNQRLIGLSGLYNIHELSLLIYLDPKEASVGKYFKNKQKEK